MVCMIISRYYRHKNFNKGYIFMEPQTLLAQNKQPIVEPAKKCKHLPVIIILVILAVGGLMKF